MTIQMSLKCAIIYTVTSIFIVFAVVCSNHFFVSGACTNNHNNCQFWTSIGECAKNPLWMLHNCPKSCKVCSGVPACVNVYNDQYCEYHLGNCWTTSSGAILIKNCRKTCVCKCCSSTPVTTPTTANVTSTAHHTTVTTAKDTTVTTAKDTTVTTLYSATTKVERTTTAKDISTAHQTTATTFYSATSKERTTMLTFGTTANTSIVSTTRRILKETKQDLGGRKTSGSNTILVLATTAGVVAFIVVLGILLIWFRRRRRSESLNQVKKPSPPPVKDDCTPPEEIIWLERPPRKSPRNPKVASMDYAEITSVKTSPRSPGTPFYHVLEDPNMAATSGNPALSAHSQRSADRLRSDSDYDEPVIRGALPAIFPPSKARENEAAYETITEHRNPSGITCNVSSKTLENDDEYCYSYTTADQNLRPENDNKLNEGPKTQGPYYYSVEGPTTGYQTLEETPESGYLQMAGSAEVSGYQPLKKSTRSFYQPLKKKYEPPRRAFTRK